MLSSFDKDLTSEEEGHLDELFQLARKHVSRLDLSDGKAIGVGIRARFLCSLKAPSAGDKSESSKSIESSSGAESNPLNSFIEELTKQNAPKANILSRQLSSGSSRSNDGSKTAPKQSI